MTAAASCHIVRIAEQRFSFPPRGFSFGPTPFFLQPPRGTWFSLRLWVPMAILVFSAFCHLLKCVSASTSAPNLRVSKAWFKFFAACFSLWLDKIFLLLCTDWVFLFIVPRCAINCVFLLAWLWFSGLLFGFWFLQRRFFSGL